MNLHGLPIALAQFVWQKTAEDKYSSPAQLG